MDTFKKDLVTKLVIIAILRNVAIVLFFSAVFIIPLMLASSRFSKMSKSEVMTVEEIKKAADTIYGRDVCTCTGSEVFADAIEEATCPICGVTHTNNVLGISKMCDDCLEITNRCHICSKLKD